MTDAIAAIVLAAGDGTRMKSNRPKVLHEVAGRSMIGHVLAALERAGVDQTVVVTAPGQETVREAVAPLTCVIQETPLGTADAVKPARDELAGFDGTVLVAYGDTPLIMPTTLAALASARAGEGSDDDPPAVVVLGFETPDPARYGRLVVGADGMLEAIVEAGEATDEQLAISLCNGGIMAVDGARLFGLLDRITNDNAKGEFYLTDIVSLARGDGLGVQVVIGEEVEMMGCDSRIGLARAEHVMQQRLRFNAMGGGVTLLAPGTVVMSHDTVIGQDTVIHPNVVIGPGVEIGERCEIKSFSHLEGAKIEAGALIGPYARLRPGAEIGEGAHIGNFVEIKNATIEAGAKANHLSYIGDGQVGAGANIGAGTITCNYDGFLKHQTNIGAGAFIGSNTALVAPVTIGEGAIVGAGSTITRDVPADALAVERADEKIVEGAAGRLRARGKVAKGAADKGKK